MFTAKNIVEFATGAVKPPGYWSLKAEMKWRISDTNMFRRLFEENRLASIPMGSSIAYQKP